MLKTLMVNGFKGLEDAKMNDLLQFTDYYYSIGEKEIRLVEPMLAYRYQGNFYGLLKELNVPIHLYLTTLYLNNLTNPVDYDGVGGNIYISKKHSIPTH